MWTIKDLTERFALTEKQVRTRLTALDQLLDGHCKTGKQNAILLDNEGFKLFERLIHIESQGITTRDAVKQMADELGKPYENRENPQGQAGADNGQAEVKQWAELAIATLQERINSLERDKAYLQRQVDADFQKMLLRYYDYITTTYRKRRAKKFSLTELTKKFHLTMILLCLKSIKLNCLQIKLYPQSHQ